MRAAQNPTYRIEQQHEDKEGILKPRSYEPYLSRQMCKP